MQSAPSRAAASLGSSFSTDSRHPLRGCGPPAVGGRRCAAACGRSRAATAVERPNDEEDASTQLDQSALHELNTAPHLRGSAPEPPASLPRWSKGSPGHPIESAPPGYRTHAGAASPNTNTDGSGTCSPHMRRTSSPDRACRSDMGTITATAPTRRDAPTAEPCRAAPCQDC